MSIVRYSYEHKVNMGNYEHVVFGLNVQADNVNDYPDMDDEELIDHVKGMVREGMKEDIIQAITDTGHDESYILHHPLAEQ